MTCAAAGEAFTAIPDAAGAILLDAAGTLIRPVRPVGDIYAEVAARHGARLGGKALTAAFRVVFPQMPPMAFPSVRPDELDRLERGWWRRLVREVLAACGASVDDFDAFFTDLYDGFADPALWEPFPEVDTALARLRAAGLRLAVVSNFDSRLEPILAGIGIAPRIDALVYSTRAGAAKPAPAIFAQALAALGLPAERAVHVGDSRSADLAGAAGAGICARLLVRGRAAEAPDEVTNLIEFADAVLERA